MAQGGGSGNKVSNGLVTASFAAVLAVYVAGYNRTQSAADKFASQVAARRPAAMLPGPTSVSEGLHPGEVHVEHRREEAKVRKGLAVKPNPVIHEEPVKPGETPAPEAIKPVAVEPIATPPPVPESIAPEPKVEAAIAPKVETAPTRVWKDGTYTGWGYSRHGDIEAEVVIAGGRILSATISQCRTRYSCSVVEKLPPQVAARQSPDVDYVSGATQSADAFYGAVVAALGKAVSFRQGCVRPLKSGFLFG
jgi:uncharacterized protein with FMN-binding domain